MERRAIEKMRRLGLTERTASGTEAVRVSAQLQAQLFDQSRAERQQVLAAWEKQIREKISRHGGTVIPGTLSLSGQTVEALLPVDTLDAIESDVADESTRLDIVEPRQVVPG